MLHSLLRSISSKLTVWKKINLADSLHREYVITCVKKIQSMARNIFSIQMSMKCLEKNYNKKMIDSMLNNNTIA